MKKNFDLNLFVALDVLLEEQSVSRAAQRLGITQPGMSHILGKLREEYNDPLMVRSNNSMQLTSFARELIDPVKSLLENSEKLINLNSQFDPQTSTQVFRIALEDAIQTAISVPLYQSLREQAPQVTLEIVRDTSFDDLASGKVDLILSHHQSSPPFYSELVYNTPFVIIASPDNTVLGGSMSLDKYVSCQHAVIYYDDDTVDSVEEEIDRQLAASSMQRQRCLRISSYIAAKKLASSTDLVAAIPSSFATRYGCDAELRVYEPPVQLTPVPVFTVWHAQHHLQAGHRWFRGLLRCLMQQELEEIAFS